MGEFEKPYSTLIGFNAAYPTGPSQDATILETILGQRTPSSLNIKEP